MNAISLTGCTPSSIFFICFQLARDALEVHAPLAHRLGVHHLSGGLEDLAFEALYPAEYNQVSTSRVESKQGLLVVLDGSGL